MKTINIKGKDYAPVDERLKEFRKDHPNYSLTTKIVELTQEWVVMQATICNDDGHILSSGTAYEKSDSSFINKTSFIENCETSAWGRALGNLGYGLVGSIASAEEVQNAINNQDNIDPTYQCDCGGSMTKHAGISQKTNKPYVKLTCTKCGKVSWE